MVLVHFYGLLHNPSPCMAFSWADHLIFKGHMNSHFHIHTLK